MYALRQLFPGVSIIYKSGEFHELKLPDLSSYTLSDVKIIDEFKFVENFQTSLANGEFLENKEQIIEFMNEYPRIGCGEFLDVSWLRPSLTFQFYDFYLQLPNSLQQKIKEKSKLHPSFLALFINKNNQDIEFNFFNYSNSADDILFNNYYSDDSIQTLEHLIKDDVDYFIDLNGKNQLDLKKEYKNPYFQKYITLIQYSALIGSIKCFKYFILNLKNYDMIDLFSLISGNREIIRLSEQNGSHFFDKYQLFSLVFRHYDIYDWITLNYKQKLPAFNSVGSDYFFQPFTSKHYKIVFRDIRLISLLINQSFSIKFMCDDFLFDLINDGRADLAKILIPLCSNLNRIYPLVNDNEILEIIL